MNKIPQHVAVIMDGNRRWARRRDLPDGQGHRQAVSRLKEIVAESIRQGIQNLTFWAFSTENWSRGEIFLKEIFGFFREILIEKKEFFDELYNEGGQIRILGDLSKFPKDITHAINRYLKLGPPPNKKIDVNFALNYGGRDELLRAFRKIIEKGYEPKEVTTDLIGRHLDTAGQPDVDFLIRTGGELRTSGFLLWQLNYAEFYFTKTHFPDFGGEEFQEALKDYALRQRRFGGNG